MADTESIKILEQIIANYKSEGIVADKLVPLLKELRERALVIKNPLMTKVVRMTYEHIQENGDFLIKYVEDDQEGDISNFEYLMRLLEDPANPYNKEELQEIRDALKHWPEEVY